jgi:hypothetical protein
MGRGTFGGAGGDENLKINFMWPKNHAISRVSIYELTII